MKPSEKEITYLQDRQKKMGVKIHSGMSGANILHYINRMQTNVYFTEREFSYLENLQEKDNHSALSFALDYIERTSIYSISKVYSRIQLKFKKFER